MTLTIRIIAPDKTVWDASAEEVILPSTTGQIGILTGHAPLLTAVDIGVMRIRSNKDWQNIALMGGFAEVEANEVTVLVNSAERSDTINIEQARLDYNEAQSRLEKISLSDNRQEQIQATQSFKKARARYQSVGGMVS
ncbi:MAG: ATP synthase F1 subunit epsilon [Synechococcales bacterium]|jgi:F-type H+-transporting ATPase subunit epsilon|nr:F0F1 ATP synthase subunit epsilon [Cyanobacteria bacterium REEB444]MEB3124535.1 ATP synthase F1 subunit epsilon [Synechococcales bacterium]NBO30994.1 F0F1 ATP synthase subunit epsilon [Cyanobacteria bacterium WB6_1B_304]